MPVLARVPVAVWLAAMSISAAAGASPASSPATDRAASHELPAPTGRHPIGTVTLDLTMPERPEPFTERPDDVRTIVVQLWYPARDSKSTPCRPVPYMDATTAEGGRRAGGDLPVGFEARVRGHACLGADPARWPRRWPVVLFSHGLGATRFGYTSLFEDLASRGYLVAALHHTYGSTMTVFADGTAHPWDDFRWQQEDEAKMLENLARNGDEWVADAEAAIELLERIEHGRARPSERIAAPLAGRLALDRLGYAGHSFGGSSALLAARRDRRIRAVANLDGRLVESIPRPFHLDVPALVLLNETSPRGADFVAGPRVHVGRLAGTNHATFSDAPWLRATFGVPDSLAARLTRPIRPVDGIALTRRALGEFFDCALKAERRRCAQLDRTLRAASAPAQAKRPE